MFERIKRYFTGPSFEELGLPAQRVDVPLYIAPEDRVPEDPEKSKAQWGNADVDGTNDTTRLAIAVSVAWAVAIVIALVFG